MRHAAIPRGWIIAMLLLLSAGIGVVYIGFEAVGKEALIEGALFQRGSSLRQHVGQMPSTHHAHRFAR